MNLSQCEELDKIDTINDTKKNLIKKECNDIGKQKLWSTKPSNTEEFVNKAKIQYNNWFDYSKVNYVNNHTKVEIICPKHGSFWITPNCHIGKNKRKGGCNLCKNENTSKRCRKTTKQFIQDAKKVWGDRYDYSKVDYKTSKCKVIITCRKHGPWQQKPGDHLSKHGCPECKNEKIQQRWIDKIGYSLEEFINASNITHNFKYDYSLVSFKSITEKVQIICPVHGIFIKQARYHMRCSGCKRCKCRSTSKPENAFLDYLNIKEENRQKRINKYNVDALVDNVIYEFLGDFWHGNPEIYKLDEYNKVCHKTYGELYNNTINRFNKLKQLGYNIKYIWENDWNKFLKKEFSTLPIKDFIE